MTVIDLEQFSKDEAIRLLRSICDRLTEGDAQTLAQACGYLPLALRVAGGILHADSALAIEAYLSRLRDAQLRLAQLRDPDDPQLDVEAVLALSYAQLDASAQFVFRQLGVFVADFSTELAQAVVETAPNGDLDAALRRLLRRNLLMYDGEQGRWRLHGLVHDLAHRCLEVADEWEPTMWRYAQSAVQLGRTTQAHYLADNECALVQFDIEWPHIDAGWHWAAAHVGTPAGDRLLLDIALETRHIGRQRCDARQKRIPIWEQAHAAAKRLDDRWGEGMALNNLGLIYEDLGEVRDAVPYYQQALTIMRDAGDRYFEGIALNNLGLAYTQLGETWRAIACFEEDLVIARSLGDPRSEGIVLAHLGDAYTHTGDVQRAIESCEFACSIAATLGDRWLEGYTLSYLAQAQALQGNLSRALSTFAQAATLLRAADEHAREIECSWQIGLALVQQGQWECALPLLRTTVAYEQEIGHAKVAEHLALLALLEAGEDCPTEPWPVSNQRTVGADEQASKNTI